VLKIAPTLQQKQFPALAEAPPIRLLRLAEPNCKKQQFAGPSGSETPAPGKAWSNAKEQEQELVWGHHIPADPMSQSTSAPTSLESTPGRQKRGRDRVIQGNLKVLKLRIQE